MGDIQVTGTQKEREDESMRTKRLWMTTLS